MTPELKAQYKADLARVRYERDAYLKRAADKWKLRIELNKRRRWLEANEAFSRHLEYKHTASMFMSEVARLTEFLRK